MPRFHAHAGFCDDWRNPPSNLCETNLTGEADAEYGVYFDRRLAKLAPASEAGEWVCVPVTPGGLVTLEVHTGENGNHDCDWVIFADARFE